jgi:uncharacterized protein with HEPN domain
MSRDWVLYVRDMVACCDKVLAYTGGIDRNDFAERGIVFDATVRNLELLGEAARQVPDAVRADHPGIEWRKIVGLRNLLIHSYFGVDEDVIWDLVQHRIQPLRDSLVDLLRRTPQG